MNPQSSGCDPHLGTPLLSTSQTPPQQSTISNFGAFPRKGDLWHSEVERGHMKRAGKEWLPIGTPGETYWDESVFRIRLYLYLILDEGTLRYSCSRPSLGESLRYTKHRHLPLIIAL